jgi:aquaporin Z
VAQALFRTARHVLPVLVAAGGGMMSQSFPNIISRSAAVVAPGLMF